MITFRSMTDVQQARLPPHLVTPVTKYMQAILSTKGYNPDNDGHLVLITPTDTDSGLCEKLGRKWQDSCFEGTARDTLCCCFVTMILRNNQFGISILIPDKDWLDPAIRARLLRELGEDTKQTESPLP